jgi:hypothetical protein
MGRSIAVIGHRAEGDTLVIQEHKQRLVAQYLACYALFTTVLALTVFVVFGIWRNTLTLLVVRYVEKSWAYNAYQNFGLIALTILGFILVMTAEPYLRDGVARKQLMKRFGKLAILLVVAGVAGLLLQVLAQL